MFRGLLFRKVTHVVFIVVLGALVYANSVGAPFIYDDGPNIVENPIVKDLSYFSDTGRAAGFERYDALLSRYIGFLTFSLNYRAGGIDVTGYHLVNILLHIINALLVYALVALSFSTPVLRESGLYEKRYWVSLLAASLFVAHPVNTQAVTYIVQRMASLMALFYLGSMVCYIKSRLTEGRGRWFYYAGALVLAVLAMKTKENAFTLPVALVLYEVMFFRGGPKRSRALLLVPFVLSMLIVPLTFIDLGKPASEVMADISERTEIAYIARDAYLLTELRVMASYLRLLVLPMNQNLDYDYPMYSSMAEGPVLGGLALVVLMMGLAVWLYRRREPAAKLASFGIVFFFLALSVESTLVPLFPIFEHRLYLPGVGMLVAASVAAVFLHGEMKGAKARAVAVLPAVMVIALSVQTVQRNSVWQSDISLWSDVVEKSPLKIEGYNNLGSALGDAGRTDDAIRYLEKAVSLKEGFAASHQERGISEAYENLGLSYLEKNEYMRAVQYFQSAIRYGPDNAKAYVNLGTTYAQMGDLDKAMEQFQRSAALDPALVEAQFNIGVAYAIKGDFDRAKERFDRTLTLDPLYTKAYFSLGMIAYNRGDMQQAGRLFERTLQLDPMHDQARQYLSLMRQ